MIAEWEPAIGALISWPFGIPQQLVQELAETEQLYILARSAADENNCKNFLTSIGVPLGRATFIRDNHNSHWTRDWGPHQVFANGQWTIIDPIFQGYPWVGQSCSMITSPGGYAGDDQVPSIVANFFGAPVAVMPQYLVGGNFLDDGHATAFATCTQIAENLQVGTEAQFRANLGSYLGISNFVALTPTENNGIQHIDCWFKPLDEETLLVKRAPAWHEEYNEIESNVAQLQTLTSVWGRPYRIIRIDCMPYNASQRIAAYNNALILNKKVYVPLFNIPADADALATWRAALPGYDVVGFPWSSWYYYDALHCRVRAIFDRHMLRITHRRLDATAPYASSYPLTAAIDDRSEAGLIADSLRVYCRVAGAPAWDWSPLTPTGQPDEYAGAIPAQPPGATVQYYIAAADNGGRSESLPRVAPDGYYSFAIQNAGIAIDAPSPPRVITPWAPSMFEVSIVPNGEAVLAGSEKLHVRFRPGGPWAALPLQPLGGESYRATLPRFVCGDAPEFYVSVTGAQYGMKTAPFGAPDASFAATVGSLAPVTLISADFEAGLPAGWSASGLWHVSSACTASPTCDGVRWAYFGQDSTCNYSTGARAQGTLRSPAVVIPALPPGGTATLTYCNTFVTEGEEGYDNGYLQVGGATIDRPTQSTAWTTRSVDLTAQAGQSIQFEWRFDTIDNYYNTFRGWQVDDIRVTTSQASCDTSPPYTPGDVNCDGAADFFDIDAFVQALADLSGYLADNPACHWRTADCDGDADVDFFDIDPFVALLGT
jgi:agmatine/peptidylarginine deiminase